MAAEALQPIQGMSDLAPPEIHLWIHLERVARELMAHYAVQEVRTPILERVEVFERSLGDGTDVVQKEMYRFEDRGGRHLALRPEGTAGVIRFIASQGQDAQDARVFYIGPMFRSERPQAGRRRQFHQLGVEAIGDPSPAADVEMIALQTHLLQAWGLDGFRIELNTRGLPEDRQNVEDGLRNALAPKRAALCADCQRRYETNPLRILDCKNPSCQALLSDLPPVSSFMSPEARAYMDDVKTLLNRLQIPYTANPRLVRGLDYYLHTVWEITHPGLGAQDALAGGGRYALSFGKQTVQGVGFALGMERVIAALTSSGIDPAAFATPPHVWLVSQGAEAFDENFMLMQSLRRRGVSCGMDVRGRSMKAQMRAANRTGTRYVILRGEREMEAGVFQLKDMVDGTQRELEMPELIEQFCLPDVTESE